MTGLKSKVINALSWSAVETVGTVGMRLFIGIFLARLLEPEEFGLIAMLVIFISLSQTLVDSGFGAALIQKQRLTDVDTSSVFFFNLAIAFCMAGLLCLGAPWAAAFYQQPLLTPLIRVLSIVIIIDSLGIVHLRLMSKRLDFKSQARINILTTAFSGGVAVFFALRGFGVWSLVVQRLVGSVLRTSFLWMLSRWRPKLVVEIKALKEMFPFGSRVLSTGLAGSVSDNFSRILIGKLYSPADLGYVERAHGVSTMPFTNLTSMLARVMFPSFASIQEDRKRMKAGLRKSITVLALMVFPMVVGLVATARPLVLSLYTEKWAASIPYLQIAVLDFLFYPFYMIHLSVLKACGRSDLLLRAEILKRIAAILALFLASRWGIIVMLWSYIGVSAMSYVLVGLFTHTLVSYPISEQIRDLLPYAVVSCIMGVGIYLINFLPFSNNWLHLFTQVGAGVLLFSLICILVKPGAFLEVKGILESKFSKGSKVQPYASPDASGG